MELIGDLRTVLKGVLEVEAKFGVGQRMNGRWKWLQHI